METVGGSGFKDIHHSLPCVCGGGGGGGEGGGGHVAY